VPRTYSIETELRASLTICDGSQEHRAQLLTHLSTDHFAGIGSAEIFARIAGLAALNKPVPSVALLRQDPALDDDAREVLETDLTAVTSDDEVEALIDQLETFRKLRCIYRAAREVLDNVKDTSPETVDKCLASLENAVLDARSRAQDIRLVTTNDSYADDVMAAVLSQTKPDRIPTGFSSFDEANGGFARKELALIAATTGGGKSVMAEQLAINAYLYGCDNVALCSFEMAEEEVYARLISNLTEIPFDKVYNKRLSVRQRMRCERAWAAFKRHGEDNDCYLTVFAPTFEVSPTQLASILEAGEYDEVLVDYVGLVEADQKKQLWENLGDITRQFKGIAKRQNAVYICFAQLDEDSNKVKYAKAMKHHSSYLWQWNYGDEQDESGRLTIEQGKIRNGKAFSFEMMANFSIMQFQDPKDGRTARRFLAGMVEPEGPVEPEPDERPAETPDEPVARRFRDRLSYRLANITDEPLGEQDL
jgi:replicative DNA helicase